MLRSSGVFKLAGEEDNKLSRKITLLCDDGEYEIVKKRSGKATLIYDSEWDQIKKKTKDGIELIDYEVPENGGVVSIRFSKKDAGKKLWLFIEKVDTNGGMEYDKSTDSK